MREELPDGRWALHTAPVLGGLTDRWIDLQSRMSDRYASRLLGARLADGAAHRGHWLVAEDEIAMRLAYRSMYRSRGASLAVAALPFRANPPAVIHAHFGELAALHRHFAQVLRRPLIASFYGYDATEAVYRTERRWRRLYARLFGAGSPVLVEGPAMASRVADLGCPTESLRVVRMPADAEALAGVRAEKADHFRVVAAGRFIEKKGFDTAIRAFARALRGKSDARLVLLGGGPLERQLRELASAERIDGQVDWVGRLPFEEFMGQVCKAHVGIYPSRTAASGDSEGGAPVTLIEAQWLGVPAIVSDHDDLPFAAAPDGSIVLPALDLEPWAESLASLYHDPSRLDGMAAAATAFAKRNNDPRQNLEAREAIYREVA